MKKHGSFYCVVDENNKYCALSVRDGGAVAWYSRREAEIAKLIFEEWHPGWYRVIEAKVLYAPKYSR